jgi:hypothetical protein
VKPYSFEGGIMKTNKRRLIPFSIVLIIALLACGPGAAPATPDLHELETNVANTLTAMSPGGLGMDSTPLPGSLPSDTPVVPTVPALPGASDTPGVPCDKVTFVSETIPDGTDFAPSAAFTKTWRVRNTGTCTWNTSYAIVFDHGDSLSAPAAVAFPGVVAPGQEVDLSLNMTAPASPGTFESFWKFRNASGVIFVTNPFSAKIDVVAPTMTMTPTLNWGIIITIGPIFILKTTQQVYQQETIPAGTTGNATIACPGSSIVTGGGFALGSNMFAYTTNMDGNGWRTYVKNNSGSSQLLNSYAICLSNSGGTTSQVYAQVRAPANDIGNAFVACPAGSVVTGGGYASNLNLTVYNSSKSGNGWQVYAKNNVGSGQLLNAYAICLAGTSATTSQVLAQSSVAGSSTGVTEATCPSGSLLTGGGFAGNTNLLIYNTSMKSGDTKTWQTYARNLVGSSSTLNSYAICTSFP